MIVYAFNRISPFSFIFTSLATLFLFPLLAFGIVYIFGGSLIPYFNSFLVLFIKFFAKCFLLVPLYTSKLKMSSIFFPLPHLFYAFLFALCLILVVIIKSEKKLLFVLLLLILVFVSYYFPDPFNKTQNDFLATLDVGQGNCALLHFDNKNYLIDCADTSYHSIPTSRSIIEPFLSFMKIKKIDGIFLTHWDKDHSGSLKEIITDLKTDFVAFPNCPSPPSQIKDFLSNTKIKQIYLQRGDNFDLKKAKVEIFHPQCNSENTLSENNLSLVFSILIDDKILLFAGDIEKEGEKDITESQISLKKADILMAPHHGAKNGLFAPFVSKVSPKIALFSVGKDNRFNHPNPSVLDYYRSINTKIFRTDKDGAILMILDDEKIKSYRYSTSPWENCLVK